MRVNDLPGLNDQRDFTASGLHQGFPDRSYGQQRRKSSVLRTYVAIREQHERLVLRNSRLRLFSNAFQCRLRSANSL